MRKSVDMCTKLPNSPLDERLRWVLPIVRKEVKLKDAALVFSGGARTLERWVASYKKSVEVALMPKSTTPLSQPNETPIRIKERIIELRRKTRLCAKKLNYKLVKENILIHDRTIGKIIKSEKLVRKYRIRKLQYKYIKPTLLPGDLIEVDIKYVPGRIGGKRYYQYTAIDCASRWRHLKIYDNMANSYSISFLEEVIRVAPFSIRAIKTDNGSCFTNRYIGYLKSSDPVNPRLHSLDIFCAELGIPHYLIDPGKPAQNGRVERSHRTDQEHFYDLNKFNSVLDLKNKLKKWNNYYNNLEHCALDGKTPNELVLINN
jgi:transposase InsO family protein